MEVSLLPLQHRSSLDLINTTGRLIIVFAAQLFCDPRNRQNNIKSGFSFMNWLLVIIVYRKCKQYMLKSPSNNYWCSWKMTYFNKPLFFKSILFAVQSNFNLMFVLSFFVMSSYLSFIFDYPIIWYAWQSNKLTNWTTVLSMCLFSIPQELVGT
jgi:hypothetical protein